MIFFLGLRYPESVAGEARLPCVVASGGVSGIPSNCALRFPKHRSGLLFFFIGGRVSRWSDISLFGWFCS